MNVRTITKPKVDKIVIELSLEEARELKEAWDDEISKGNISSMIYSKLVDCLYDINE